MANEIQVDLSVSVTNGNLDFAQADTFEADQTTAKGGNPGTVTIGTSEEAISFGDITSLGIVIIKNLDETNYITWGPESGGTMVVVGKLKPGESAVLRLNPGITLRAQANTASCNVRIFAFDD